MANYEDITEDRDVSEAVMDHDEESIPENEIPLYQEIPDNAIIFHSMDGHHYMIDRGSVNWEQTAANEDYLQQNMFVIRQQLMNLFLSRDGVTEVDTEFARTVVKDIVTSTGCTPKYTATFPEADHYDIAQMYCIDALELMNLFLKEIAVFNVNKSIADCLNSFTQEDISHEDRVQYDQPAVPGGDTTDYGEHTSAGIDG